MHAHAEDHAHRLGLPIGVLRAPQGQLAAAFLDQAERVELLEGGAWPLAYSGTPRKRFSKMAASEARGPESRACRTSATTPSTPGAFMASTSPGASRSPLRRAGCLARPLS
eukprot:9460042-Pyramimonas_sp.AAC.1